MKQTIFLLLFVLVASSAHSQVVLLDEDQNSVFAYGGYARAQGLSGYSFTLGVTPRGKTDIGFTATALEFNSRRTWDYGQFIQLYVVKPKPNAKAAYFSIIESLQLISSSPQGAKSNLTLILGGMFEAKSKPSPNSSVVLSVGMLWTIPTRRGVESFPSLPLQLVIADHFKNIIFSISPSIVVSNDATAYGIGISLSIVGSKSDRFR